ncbi:glutamine amidotransferase [Pseudogracilibacillus auburnensis]|uniref:glutamine amidotransferase n=1 Tax=Pseudogracilibacillus auburnensis TaxID=1494959 RepID=UPI001D9B03AD|nr:glutamine amidotransferase [Pseudogracilibacillus auburnensis]MBO1005664.1 cytoplasmic protein [Pseudogracilibacillus auburnensis]
MSLKILFAGESWMKHIIHVKGFDSFTTSEYDEGVKWIREAFVEEGHEFDYLPSHVVPNQFPTTLEELKKYDVVIISDVGANSLLLSSTTFDQSVIAPNRLQLIHDYVEQGGGFMMIGGYLTFQGIEALGKYFGTPIEKCLPVNLHPHDDRMEKPEGITPLEMNGEHPILKGVPSQWPAFLGYNQLIAKDSAEVLVKAGDDPFLAVHEYGDGRTAAFASDCSPHWGPKEFLDWDGYANLWNGIVTWLAKK